MYILSWFFLSLAFLVYSFSPSPIHSIMLLHTCALASTLSCAGPWYEYTSSSVVLHPLRLNEALWLMINLQRYHEIVYFPLRLSILKDNKTTKAKPINTKATLFAASI